MKGLLVHNTTYTKGIQILESGYLKSVSEVPENAEYLYDSDDEEEKEQYLNTLRNKIFLSLLFETKKVSMKKMRTAGVGQGFNFYFDPKIMSDYGHMDYSEKYKIKSVAKIFDPKVRCWINKDWYRGYFLKKFNSLEYDKTKSLEENIELFYKNIKPENPKLKNEVIINDKKFKLSKYLLAVGVDNHYDKNYIEDLRADYPDIIFFDKEEQEEFLKLYLEKS
jgi:hypothetical protein